MGKPKGTCEKMPSDDSSSTSAQAMKSTSPLQEFPKIKSARIVGNTWMTW